jgi:hypothetical protein
MPSGAPNIALHLLSSHPTIYFMSLPMQPFTKAISPEEVNEMHHTLRRSSVRIPNP